MNKHRKQLINWLFEITMVIYCKFKKKTAWNITTEELLNMPTNCFGFHLGTFLNNRGFELIPKVERHDAYHLLTGYGTKVEDEIALQYACFGNGKRTPYLFGVIILGTLLLPDYLKYYMKGYRFGNGCNSFHHFDFKKVLPLDFELFRSTIFSELELKKLHNIQTTKTNINFKTT